MNRGALRSATAYLATGGIAILSMVALNVAADRINSSGLQALRRYATGSN